MAKTFKQYAKKPTKVNYRRTTKVKSFPGKIKKSKRYSDGTLGRFVKEVKGKPGSEFIQKGIMLGVADYVNGDQ